MTGDLAMDVQASGAARRRRGRLTNQEKKAYLGRCRDNERLF